MIFEESRNAAGGEKKGGIKASRFFAKLIPPSPPHLDRPSIGAAYGVATPTTSAQQRRILAFASLWVITIGYDYELCF